MLKPEELPLGYRFNPTDGEIIRYLRSKVKGEDMRWFSSVISEEDLYGEAPPWVIFQNHHQPPSSISLIKSLNNIIGEDHHNVRYFYTRLKKKNELGERIHRMFGKNEEYCWLGQDKGRDIYDYRTMTVIGTRKLFSLTRSNQKKNKGAENSKKIKRKKTSSSTKDIHEDDHGDQESFGNWIMHEYSLVNYPPSSSSSSSSSVYNRSNYVLCKIRMKDPPKFTTTATGNAATHDHDAAAINSSTTTSVPSSTSTAHDYQDQQQQQQQQDDDHPGAANVAVPLLLPIGTDNNQINIQHQDQGNLSQDTYDQLFHKDEQHELLALMYGTQEVLQPAATMEVSLGSVSESEAGHGLDSRDGCGSSSHECNELLQVDNSFVSMEVQVLPVLVSNSMVGDQEQEQHYSSSNNDMPPMPSLYSQMSMKVQEKENHGGGGTSDHLDNLDNGWTGFVNFDDHDQNNYMNALTDDLLLDNGEYNTFWENVWLCPQPPSHHQAAAGSILIPSTDDTNR